MHDEPVLTVREFAQRLKASEETVRRWLKTGRVRGVMLGGTKLGYRIPESEIGRILGKASTSHEQATDAPR